MKSGLTVWHIRLLSNLKEKHAIWWLAWLIFLQYDKNHQPKVAILLRYIIMFLFFIFLYVSAIKLYKEIKHTLWIYKILISVFRVLMIRVHDVLKSLWVVEWFSTCGWTLEWSLPNTISSELAGRLFPMPDCFIWFKRFFRINQFLREIFLHNTYRWAI